jgi:hypothetical protein
VGVPADDASQQGPAASVGDTPNAMAATEDERVVATPPAVAPDPAPSCETVSDLLPYAGCVMLHDLFRADGFGGLVLDRKFRFEFEADGRLLTGFEDDGGDGVWESVTTYFYDDEGHRVGIETAGIFDHEVERVVIETWEGDHLAKLEVDGDGDGEFDLVEEYTYGVGGCPEGYRAETRAGVSSGRHSYDSHGNRVQTFRDLDVDGTVDEVVTMEYEEVAGAWRQVAEYVDGNADGVASQVTIHRHEGNTVVESLVYLVDQNGEFELAIRYEETFDEVGKSVLARNYDLRLDDDSPQYESRSTYECE